MNSDIIVAYNLISWDLSKFWILCTYEHKSKCSQHSG